MVQQRIALFFSGKFTALESVAAAPSADNFFCSSCTAATLAGAFSGLLAYGIGFMAGVGGYNGWQ